MQSILFKSQDASLLLVDIPRSIEEAQVPPGQPPISRLYSNPPPADPFHLPEPKDGSCTNWPPLTPAAQVADLMTSAACRAALEQLRHQYSGPFCLPRVPPPPDAGVNAAPRIPPGAEYLHGSIQETRQTFLDTAPRFRLILMDPPWPNRSARRRTTNRYDTVADLAEMRRLLSAIPVPLHLAQDGLVALWITNKPSIVEMLTAPTTGLFASWGVELVTEWTWLKVAASGDPLFDLDSWWRKPWERLLIAKRVGVPPPAALKPKVIVAVPDAHSRKPNLRTQFDDVLGHDSPVLEVFARTLTSGWWSWGNEVLKFQAPQYWTDHALTGT